MVGWGVVGQNVSELHHDVVMSAAIDNEPIYYNSLFRHGVDDKRRVQIPAKWRPEQPNTQFYLILWPHENIPQSCLMVFAPAEWRELVQKLKSLPFNHPDTLKLRRLIGTNTVTADLDRSGRICIPEGMAKAAGITKEVVLVGLVDRFQIWSAERYEDVQKGDEKMSAEAFNQLS
jgi:MraZ protein